VDEPLVAMLAGPVREPLVPLATRVAADVTGAAMEVAAGVTGSATEVAAEVIESAVDVTVGGDEVDGAKVAACACRENSSKTAKVPAAKITTCTARRAM
jgi:hypothetical protein